jgi:hypothetical protein
VTGDGRKLDAAERHNLYSPPYIIRLIDQGGMTWARHGMGEMRCLYFSEVSGSHGGEYDDCLLGCCAA